LILNNQSISPYYPVIPEGMKSHVRFFTTCPLTMHEAKLFNACLEALDRYLTDTGYVFPDIAVNCCFLGSGDVSLSFGDNSDFGLYVTFAFYPVYLWRAALLSDPKLIACMLEELCHHFFPALDEIQVTYQVEKIAVIIHPSLTHELLYPGMHK